MLAPQIVDQKHASAATEEWVLEERHLVQIARSSLHHGEQAPESGRK